MFGAIGGLITFIIIAVIILFVLSTCIRVVPQAQALVVERLGAYLGTYSVGIPGSLHRPCGQEGKP